MKSSLSLFGRVLILLSIGLFGLDLARSSYFSKLIFIGFGDMLVIFHEGAMSPYFWGMSAGMFWNLGLQPLLEAPACIILFCIGIIAFLLPLEGGSPT